MTTSGSASTAVSDETSDSRILFVSQVSQSVAASFGPDIEIVDYAALSAELLRRFDPHFVVSPILTPGFDIVDLAERLCQFGFTGAYRVLTETPLPDPDLVLREVRMQCPGLDVDILTMEMLRG